MKKSTVLSILILISFSSFAQLAMPKIFGNNMVLQRNKPNAIWGTGLAGNTIHIWFGNNSYTTQINDLGDWFLKTDTLHVGDPFALYVEEKNGEVVIAEKHFENVVVGDVWLASGQSNMEMKLKDTENAHGVVTKADNSNIRFFTVERSTQTTPQNDVLGSEWKLCDSVSALEFSAVGYYFSKNIYDEIQVPVGVILSSWGGTPVTTWTSAESMSKIPGWKKIIEQNKIDSVNSDSVETDFKRMDAFYDIVINSYKGLNKGFTDSKFDDAEWEVVTMPETYRGKECLNDIMWLRKSIDIPKNMVGSNLKINLGFPEILYSLYFNGHEICKNNWNARETHDYTIPAEYVSKGENNITLRLAVIWGGGGIDEPADSLYITNGNNTISLAGEWKYIRNIETPFPEIKNYFKAPSYLFNGMINPIVPYALTGVIWYQGEENASNPHGYSELLQTLIYDWRGLWSEQELPFLYVQLPNFLKRLDYPSESDWSVLREEQLKTLRTPNTAMIVAIDLGEADDIHPKNKKDVANRLSLAALDIVYNKPYPYTGPLCIDYSVQADSILLFFENYQSNGMYAKGSDELKGFAIAGADSVYHWAQAKIIGNTVIVWCDDVKNPVHVRYAWGDNPDCNLYNIEGIPASPFRTDNW